MIQMSKRLLLNTYQTKIELKHHRSMKYLSTIFIIFLVTIEVFSQGTQLLRQPTLSDTEVVFVYANDLWKASRDGGAAIRMTTNEGYESNPHFSPDGQTIAFSAQYGGNTDVYIISSQGGSPERLTYHPSGDFVQGWTPEGDIIFRSSRTGHPTITNKLYKVSLNGGLPTALPVPRAAYGEVSPDGEYVAHTPITSWDPEWRNYRGGQAMPIWIQNLESGDLTRIPQPDQERHVSPVWIGKKVIYISERDYVANLWSYDVSTGAEEQITTHKKFDVKSVDAHGDDLIYEQGGYLHLIADGVTRQLDITVSGDMNFAMPRWESVNAWALSNANLSPNGKRAIFEYRGEVVTIPKKNGSHRNLTNTSNVADRAPIWSPEGDRIAYFNDESGEYKLIIADQFGEKIKELSIPAGTFYFTPDWSPDGASLAFSDTDYNIWVVDIETGTSKKIDTDSYAHPNRTMNPQWSPDSRYVAYVKQQNSHFKSVFVYDNELSITQQITQGLADIATPIWDQNGDYLYYLASTDYGLASGWLDMSSYDPSVSRTLYASVLHRDGKSPLLLKTDDEEVEEEEEDTEEKADEEESEEEESEEEESEEEEEKTIDFEGIQERVVGFKDVSGNYFALDRAPEGHVIVYGFEDGDLNAHKYNVSEQELNDYAMDIDRMNTTSSGSHALIFRSGSWFISSLSGKPDFGKDRINHNFKIRVDPRGEYQQIFKEGWRFMRDFLYVDNVHGAPWDQVWDWYSPWIDHVAHRTDLNYVVDIMSGEVAIGHSYVAGGDMPDIDRVGIGLLGADFSIENGLYRIAKIYTGEQWNADLFAPLKMPGLDIQEGDYITSVNGSPLTGSDNIYSFFEETAGKQVMLTVKSLLAGEERTVTVQPTGSEFLLRMHDWIEGNRRKVDELSDGQLAYVYVPNTAGRGFTFFNRYYFSQQDKKGVVIDERNNGGGSAADYMIDIMNRKLFGYFNSKTETNRPWTTPIAGIWGPKVMIINERAGSGGDLLPYMFRAAGIGPLVGTRTWGGLVGTWDTPLFIDGGRMVAPRGGFFDADGEWSVEGEGVAPDIEVIQDPKLVMQGKDPQLEAAVQEALRLLEANPFEMKPEPAAPVRWKRPAGWDKE